ncbi:MAG: DcrB-related protein [Candidatus Methylacidiphilales bacterium]|nr:DcrB-related protein [Candidatus Methylacidiphilales bacterium]
MRRLLALGLLALLAIVPFTATAAEVKSDELGFSYEVPDDWKVMTKKDISAYPLALGPTEGDFTANINVVKEDFGGTIDAYVEANMVTLRKSFKNLKEVDSSKFVTKSGLEGRRVITEHDTFQKDLRQCFYFFKAAKGDTWIVVTTSCLTSVGEKLQPTFDGILKTFSNGTGSSGGGAGGAM